MVQVVRRPPKLREPSALDRILQFLSVGTSVAGTVSGIQARDRQLDLQEERLGFAKLERDKAKAKDIVGGMQQQRIEETAISFEDAGPLAIAPQIFEALRNTPFSLNDPDLFVNAMVANGLKQRNSLLDPASPSFVARLTYEHFDPQTSEFLKDTRARELGVDPSEIADNELVFAGQGSISRLDVEKIVQLSALADEDLSVLASIGLNRDLTGQAIPLDVTLAQARVGASPFVDEIMRGAAEGRPAAYEQVAKTVPWLPQSLGIQMDITEPAFLAKIGKPGQPFTINISDAQMAGIYWNDLQAQTTSDPSLVQSLFKQASEQKTSLLVASGVDPAQAAVIGSGQADYFELAVKVDPSLTKDKWRNSPEWKDLRRISQEFKKTQLAAAHVKFLANSPLANRTQKTVQWFKDHGLDPYDANAVKKAIPLLERLNAELGNIYHVPSAENPWYWFNDVDYFEGAATSGLSPQGGLFGPLFEGQDRDLSLRDAYTSQKEQDKTQLFLAAPELQEQMLLAFSALTVEGVKIYTDTEIADLRSEIVAKRAGGIPGNIP